MKSLQISLMVTFLFGLVVLSAPSLLAAIDLTIDEQLFLNKKKFIGVCTDPDWMPYEKITESGEHIGILADFQALWSQKIGKEISLIKTESWSQSLEYIKQGRCDILSSAQVTEQRLEFLNFTQPFVVYPIVLATRNNDLLYESFSQLLEKQLAIVKGYAIIEVLRKKYPQIKIVEVANAKEGLLLVSKGKAFGYIDTVATIAYQSQAHGILNLKMLSVLDESYSMAIGIRKDEPLLLSIFDKAVASLTEEERHTILNRWVAIQYAEPVNYSLYWKIIGTILFILGLMTYRNRIISRYNTQLRQLNQQLEHLSNTDPLTGVLNRHALGKLFHHEIARCERYQTRFAVIMADIDHFKQINDLYGHNTGDRVLKEIAHILTQNIRKNDAVGRWGGEEFIIACPQTDQQGALRLSESLRVLIEQHHFDMASSITSSFGVTVYNGHESTESFIKRVDDALYHAKHSGRNRVEFL
jgi:diguanylate cyclase (GGDEF)-like protein